MKGENRLKIFELLKNSILAVDEVFFVFSLPYGSSFHKIESSLRKYREKRDIYMRQMRENKENQNRFKHFIYHLRKEGLVENVKKDTGMFVKITSAGEKLLSKLRQRKDQGLPEKTYPVLEKDELKIIIFDVPEKEKRKRAWLRSVLRNLEFTMIQKSVWSGKTKLPQEFINQLHKLNLLSYVEIFTISKTGTLKKLKT
ncbi:CRISPR-associated endonuclease Cas2 [Patescibacteria group bacterium]|nr:MAG: CRISPR-associated endonuclease Cas2 [Patescibacteria group bacterium]